MIILIVEIDGYFQQVFLSGKKCSREQLKQKYLQVKKLTCEMKDFPNIFCRIHNFEQIPNVCDIKVDFVIDTDTDRVYSPSY